MIPALSGSTPIVPLLADYRAIHQNAPLKEELACRGLTLLALFRRRLHDPWPHMRRQLSRWRYRIRYRLWPVDQADASQPPLGHELWHLTTRLVRTVRMHTLVVVTNLVAGRPPRNSRILLPETCTRG